VNRARRRFEQRTGIDTSGLDKRQARRLMRRWSADWLAYRIAREPRFHP